ncbi:MAG: PDDEXK nuclease domain-containing protein [Bacteroidales bacterium]|nr:PDDEXK nuclease domain-containing protein [Bacteroidales bacterium]
MKLDSPTYQQFFADIKDRIRNAQYLALKKVNKELISLYWDIGRSIKEKQEAEGWGKSVVEKLSMDLQKEFPGIRGFSQANLWRMRSFYMTYHQAENLALMVREIGWSHNVLIMEKCADMLECEFYIRMTRKYSWTKNVLKHQIEGNAYAHAMTSQNNFDTQLPEKYKQQAVLAMKDEYHFGFLELTEKHSEHELEQAILQNIRRFLTEMGGDFSFIANQYRLVVEQQEYFIDLLLFHRRLQSLVAIELKVGDFSPEYAGKMQFYLSVLNDTQKLEHENPAIGIIVCKTKSRTVVEYALKESNQPMGVASYSMHSQLPKHWEKLLPTPEQISKNLKWIENEFNV